MRGAGPTAAAMAGVVRRDAQLYFSYRWRVVTQPLTIVFTLTLFYYVSRLVRAEGFPRQGDYFAFVVVGLVVVELLTASLAATPAAVRNELVAGTFERLVTSPLGPGASLVAMCAFPVLLALAVATATIALATLVFGFPLELPTALLALPVAVLAVLAFLPLALLAVAVVLLAKQANAVTTFIVTGLSLSSGAFFPVGLLPGWLAWVADVQPLTPALDLMRHALIDTPVPGGIPGALAKLIGAALVLTPLALAALSSAVERCRRLGTLVEY